MSGKNKIQGELETDEIKKGLDILKKIGIVDLVLSGGEPLLGTISAKYLIMPQNVLLLLFVIMEVWLQKKLRPYEMWILLRFR